MIERVILRGRVRSAGVKVGVRIYDFFVLWTVRDFRGMVVFVDLLI